MAVSASESFPRSYLTRFRGDTVRDWDFLCAYCALIFPAAVSQTSICGTSHARRASISGLARGAHSPTRGDRPASLDGTPRRRGRLLPSANTWLHHGGAQLPLATLPRRD